MKDSGYLGIYLGKNTATVVSLGSEGAGRNVMGCFSVTVQRQEQQGPQELARLIAEGCAERGLKFSDAAVALDCSMFMQHKLHSQFSDPKQIAATVRFDAEEALAMDITSLAIAFRVTSSDQNGSSLTVFTAQQKQLSDILIALQSNNIDPVTMEPDVNCLSRFISENISLQQDLRSLFCVLSDSNGYFIAFEGSQKTLFMRTFLVSHGQKREELLAREIPVTAALVGTGEPVSCVKFFDSAGSVDYQRLSEKLSTEVDKLNLAEVAAADSGILADCSDTVGFAIAYGAALSHLENAQSVDFRSDFMPYQGRKVRLQNMIKFSSIILTILMLAAGVYFNMQLLQENKYRSQLRRKFEKQYSAVMFGQKLPPKSEPAHKLANELRRIESVKKGLSSITGEEAISAKLTLVLEAFNKCAEQTDLNIDSIGITTKTISIAGDTSSKKNTLRLFDAIKENGLEIQSQYLEAKGGRDNFSITVVPKK